VAASICATMRAASVTVTTDPIADRSVSHLANAFLGLLE